MKKAILITLCTISGWMVCETMFAGNKAELPDLNPDDYKELLSSSKPAHCKDCQQHNSNSRSPLSK